MVLSIALVVILALSAMGVSAGEGMYVSGAETGAVYLRKAPASSDYYTTLSNGTYVESVGWQLGWDGVGYNQVIYNGTWGWITTRYLSYNNYANMPGETMYVYGAETGRVYLRYSPASSGYYTTINNDTKVKSIGWQLGWDGVGYNQVVVNGQVGWITTKYLSYSTPGATWRSGVIKGASTGNVYIWKDAYSQSWITTIPVGTWIQYKPASATNGRVYGRYANSYGTVYEGWFTGQYVYNW